MTDGRGYIYGWRSEIPGQVVGCGKRYFRVANPGQRHNLDSRAGSVSRDVCSIPASDVWAQMKVFIEGVGL